VDFRTPRLGGEKHVSFPEVRRQVRWHYQWILVNEFLPVILQEQTYKSVFPDPYNPAPAIPRLRENDLKLYAEPAFQPIADFTHNGTFGLAELINVALGHTP
jgi:hypothetical protein